MSSPIKTSPPTGPPAALDRSGDRFGDRVDHREGHLTTTHHGLPMPGLSGTANSPTDGDKQATSSKAPLMTRESSRMPPSWSASNSTSRLKCTSPRASVATSSWAFINGAYDQPRITSAFNDNRNNAFVPGLLFLGGSKSDDGCEFQTSNMRARLQLSSHGFMLAAGNGSVLVLQITLRFTFDFIVTEPCGLDGGNGDAEAKWSRISTNSGRNGEGCKIGPEMVDGKNERMEREAQHSLSLSVVMTITIMTINTSTLS
ncbi:hypothetical protein GGS21DRAFT_389436 [Xylaria nigripes]|nr:hypothetical protein GGS21DRAFT_389436 [Xylaria nigripes]